MDENPAVLSNVQDQKKRQRKRITKAVTNVFVTYETSYTISDASFGSKEFI